MFQQLQRRLVEQAPRFLRHPLKLVPFNLQKQLMESLLARVFMRSKVTSEWSETIRRVQRQK